jgi:hypothetical protein
MQSARRLAPGDFRIDDGFTAATAIIDHDDEILHAGDLASSLTTGIECGNISENRKLVQW